MKKVVFTAQSFGFGPVSKLLAVSENIRNVRRIFFGSGVAYDLAKISNFDEICEYSLSSDRDKILVLLSDADVFVNVMDFSLNCLAQIAGCPYVLIDSLLWFYPFKPEGIENADVYFVQNFFDLVEPKIKEYRLTNARIIGPIINNHFHRYEKKNQVIVNFGGCDGKAADSSIEVGINHNLPFILLKILLPVLREHFSEILVTGRERVMQSCREAFSEGDFLKFRMLEPKSMLEEASRSICIFTIPGIQSFYDMGNFCPIFGLPPMNHSHVRNLEIFVKRGIIQHYLKWDELYDFPFDKCKTRQERIDLVLSAIKRFEQSMEGQAVFMGKVKEFLQSQATWPDLVNRQKSALISLGPNGVEEITKAIYKILESQGQPLTSIFYREGV
jgi:hypothetical protein